MDAEGPITNRRCPTRFTAAQRTFVIERVRDIAWRLRDPAYTLRISRVAAEQSKYLRAPGYRMRSLTQGPLGLALMYGELARVFPGEEWDQAAHDYLTLVPREIVIDEPQWAGLFSGASGLLFVAHQVSRGGSRYQNLRQEIETALTLQLARYTHALTTIHRPNSEDYDLRNGAVGICAALLTLPDQSSTSQGLSLLMRHLTWLGERDIERDVRHFDAWYRSRDLRDAQIQWRATDSAFRDYGMCSGLAGLIAVLSLALMSDSSLDLDRLPEAVEVLCRHVRQGARRDAQGWYWPRRQPEGRPHRPGVPARFSWCAGTSGIARALWLASRALNDVSLGTFALECIQEVGQYIRQQQTVIGPSLCSGLAGIAQVCARFADETDEPAVEDTMEAAIDRLLSLYEPDRPFGYRTFEPEFIRVDSPWLLNGAAGVVLALLAGMSPTPPTWDRIMLLG